MLRTTLASSRTLRVCVLGLVTLTTAIIYTSDSAEARRYRHRHMRAPRAHHVARASYSPQFASIIVDGNSGATLSSNNPDALRHPASLTKIMTLYLLFEQLERGKLKLDSEMDVSAVRFPAGADQARPEARPDHQGRRRHQGTGDALRQRRLRRDRGSHCRRRRRFRQADDAQGARARHEQDGLSQRQRPAQR